MLDERARDCLIRYLFRRGIAHQAVSLDRLRQAPLRLLPGSMISTFSRKAWLLTLSAIVLIAAAGYHAGDSERAPDTREWSDITRAAVSASVPAPATPASATAPAVREWSAAVAPGLPLDLRATFETTPDLFGYAQQLRRAGDLGNAEATWLLSRISDYCASYALDPQGYALDNQTLATMDLKAAPGFIGARERVGQRCIGFTRGDGLGRTLALTQRRQAAMAGNLAAEAALLAAGAPLSREPGYRRVLVERVAHSRDPEAFLALSPAMGAAAAGDDAYHGLVAGDQYSQLAWQMAACELGLACGPNSTLMNSYCANGGVCSRDPGQDFRSFVFDAAVPRQGMEKMTELLNRLLRKQGDRA